MLLQHATDLQYTPSCCVNVSNVTTRIRLSTIRQCLTKCCIRAPHNMVSRSAPEYIEKCSGVWGSGSRMGSAMVPLDRVLMSSYRLSIVLIPLSAMVWLQFVMQILKAFWSPNLPFPWGPEPLCNTTLLVTTWVTMKKRHHITSNISSRVHECDRCTDHGKVRSVVGRNWLQWWQLIITRNDTDIL